MELTTQDKLRMWARWSKSGVNDVGYKSIWEAIERNAPVVDGGYIPYQEINYSDPKMSDTYASIIDKAVTLFSKEAPLLGEIIKRKYLRNHSNKEIARYYLTPLEYPEQAGMDWDDPEKKKVSTRMATNLVSMAHGAVEIQIEALEFKYAIDPSCYGL